MQVDPVASMRCWPVALELGGREFEIPALPAADWWPIVSTGNVTGVLDLVVSTPDVDLDEYLLSGRIDPEELVQVLRDAIEAATGRLVHAALIIAIVAANNWPVVNGRLALQGFRWDVMPIGAALDALYVIISESLKEESLKKFSDLLNNESLTTGKISETQRKQALADFEEIAGPRPTSAEPASAAPSGSRPPRIRRSRVRARPSDPRP